MNVTKCKTQAENETQQKYKATKEMSYKWTLENTNEKCKLKA
jgi:hypothetical protein